jgi:hypothetical protein
MEEQEKRIEELTAQVKQQAAQIQKVSAQLELSRKLSTTKAAFIVMSRHASTAWRLFASGA